MRPKSKNPLSKNISFNYTPEKYSALEKLAHESKMTLSGYIRKRMDETIEKGAVYRQGPLILVNTREVSPAEPDTSQK